MNFDKDVETVLQALDRSKANVPKDWDYLAQDEDFCMQVMEMQYQEKPLSAHLGIDKELFPAVEQLEDDEVNAIVNKILDTWSTYNYFADLPKGLPIRIAYTTLLSVWEEVVGCYPIGEFHFDFYDQDLDQYVTPKPLEENEELPF